MMMTMKQQQGRLFWFLITIWEILRLSHGMTVVEGLPAFVDVSTKKHRIKPHTQQRLFQRPPIGASYQKTVGIPVLGKQTFSLCILTDNTAHLLVQGKMLSLNEIVPYTMNHDNGCLNCELSDHAIATMRKVRASLKEVGYDCTTDTPYVKVSTPLPMPVKIHLKRREEDDDNPQERFADFGEEEETLDNDLERDVLP